MPRPFRRATWQMCHCRIAAAFPLWGQWLTWVNWGYSNYNSGTFSVKNREWHGLTLLSSFMWAKNLSSSVSPISERQEQFRLSPVGPLARKSGSNSR